MIVCLYSKAKALFFHVTLEGQARGILGAYFLKGVPLSSRLVFSRLTPKGAHGAYFSNFAYIESSASVTIQRLGYRLNNVIKKNSEQL